MQSYSAHASEEAAKAALQHPWLQELEPLRAQMNALLADPITAMSAEQVLNEIEEMWESKGSVSDRLQHPWLQEAEVLRATLAEIRARQIVEA